MPGVDGPDDTGVDVGEHGAHGADLPLRVRVAAVDDVQEQVGVDGFNAVWTSPETLPTPLEITDPTTWVRRVHG